MSGEHSTSSSGAYIAEIEQEVLGALLFGGDFRKVVGFLKSEHFIPDIHKLIFDAIRTAFEQYGSTTVPVVARLLPQDVADGFMSKTGKSPAGYLASLSDFNVRGNAGLETMGRAVVSQWARLKTGDLALRLNEAAADPSSDPAKMIQNMASDLDNVAAEMRAGPRRKTQTSIAEASRNAVLEIEAAMQRGSGLTGVTWGLTDVNRMTGGIQRGEMVVMGARPSMGKTAAALSIGLRCAKSGVGTGFLSLEMGSSRLAMRAMTDLAFDWGVKVPYSDLITGKVERTDFDAMKLAAADLEKLPLRIEEQSGLSLSDIRVKLERMMEELERAGAPLGVLLVDYLQLIKPSNRYTGNRNNEITEISAGLRGFAREYDIGVVALSQLSRNIESRPLSERRPMMSDLRDSGAIEQDADTIIFLFREAYYLQKEKGKDAEAEADRIGRLADCETKLEFILSKQRNGPVGTVDLFIDVACSAVRNAVRF